MIKHEYKKAGLLYSVQMVFVMIMVMIIFSGGVYLGSQTVDNYRRDMLIEQSKAIDHALQMYAKAHLAVDTSTCVINDEKTKLKYTKTRIYPNNLQELGVIRDNFGYLSRHLKFQSLDNVNYDLFRYSVQKSDDGNMTYQLEVKLPNGYNYTSPGSNK